MSDLARARALLARADVRFGHRWWAPLGFVAVLLAVSVRDLVVGRRP